MVLSKAPHQGHPSAFKNLDEKQIAVYLETQQTSSDLRLCGSLALCWCHCWWRNAGAKGDGLPTGPAGLICAETFPRSRSCIPSEATLHLIASVPFWFLYLPWDERKCCLRCFQVWLPVLASWTSSFWWLSSNVSYCRNCQARVCPPSFFSSNIYILFFFTVLLPFVLCMTSKQVRVIQDFVFRSCADFLGAL